MQLVELGAAPRGQTEQAREVGDLYCVFWDRIITEKPRSESESRGPWAGEPHVQEVAARWAAEDATQSE